MGEANKGPGDRDHDPGDPWGRFREARERAGFVTRAAAAKALGLDPTEIRRYETGLRGGTPMLPIVPHVVETMAAGYGVPVSYLLGLSEELPQVNPARCASIAADLRRMADELDALTGRAGPGPRERVPIEEAQRGAELLARGPGPVPRKAGDR